jgi:hypothetical protein
VLFATPIDVFITPIKPGELAAVMAEVAAHGSRPTRPRIRPLRACQVIEIDG